AGVELFHDPDGRAFATIPIDGRREVWPVESRSFRRWLRLQLHRAQRRVANTTSLSDAIELLCAEAEFDGPEAEVFVRVAPYEDGVLIDLADEEWRAVEVRPRGGKIVAAAP